MTTVISDRNPIKVARRLRKRIRRDIQSGELRNGMHVSSPSFAKLSPLGKRIVRGKIEGFTPAIIRFNTRMRPLKVVWDDQLGRFAVINT